MKHLFCILMAFVLALTASAQREQDFASRYMALYGQGSGLKCITVSPLMMKQMIQSTIVGNDKDIKNILSQVKSIQMLTSTSAEADKYYEKALALAKQNPDRYKALPENEHLYVRRRGDTIVEMVLVMESKGLFSLINLTGEMNEDFLEKIKQSKR